MGGCTSLSTYQLVNFFTIQGFTFTQPFRIATAPQEDRLGILPQAEFHYLI